MKNYTKIICLIAAVCLLGAAAFCGYHIYDHYAQESEQEEAFAELAELVEQAQDTEVDIHETAEAPLIEEETILP